MICLDNTFLGLVLSIGSKAPDDPKTGKPIERLDERIEDLIERWQKGNEKAIIPTPVLSEFLIVAGSQGADYLDEIENASHFIVRSFDQKAAVELAALYQTMDAKLSKRARKVGNSDTKAKMKFDRQIVAIAKSNGATTIYSDDNGVKNFAAEVGITVVKTHELPYPSPKVQKLEFGEPEIEGKGNKVEPITSGKRTRTIGDGKPVAKQPETKT
jgi:predicted nucleic acid-binding protein